jgi:hypothetical protein
MVPRFRRESVKRFPVPRLLFLMSLTLIAGSLCPSPVVGQTPDLAVRQAYLRAVAGYFQVPLEEVTVLGEWDLKTDEVPVVLFLADRAGVSSDALIGLRSGGQSWWQVSGRFGLGAQPIFLALPEDEPLGLLERPYTEFRNRSHGEWDLVALSDEEIIALVNLRVLSEQVGVPPLRVLRSFEEAGSFVEGFSTLLGLGLRP